MRILELYRRRRLIYELLDEHDREEWEYLTRDPAAWIEALSKFSAHHNSQPVGSGASKWREAVEAKLRSWPAW